MIWRPSPGASIAAAMLAVAQACAARPASPPSLPLFDEDRLVAQVWRLADERLDLMPAVAAAKWSRMGIADPSREAQVIHAAGDRAAAVGLAREPVERLMSVQIDAARRVQEELTAHWRRDGYDYGGTALRLASDLRPRLDRLTRELVAALYLMAPFAAVADRTPHPDTRLTRSERGAFAAALAAIRFEAGGSIGRARAAGVLRIGTPADYAPFAVASGDRVSGADVQLAADLAAALGLAPVFVRTSWATLLDGLAADHFDLVVGGVSATPSRLARAQASVPLSRSGKTAIGRCTDRARFGSLAAIDVPAVRVIENPGGTNESFARARLARAQLLIHADNRTVFGEILAGRADVMFTDETEIRLEMRRHPRLCRLLGAAFEPADKVFLMARGGDWTEAVDPWLMEAVAAGTPSRLLDQNLR